MATNPVFAKIDSDLDKRGYASFRTGGQQAPTQQGPQQAWGQPTPVTYDQGFGTYPHVPGGAPAGERRMTFDDVLMKSLTLFGLLLASAVAGWLVTEQNPTTGRMIWMAGMVIGLVIGIAIAFMKSVNVPLILAYAVAEGAFVGAFSRFMEEFYAGIVVSAITATLAVFVAMFALWRTNIIKVTNRARRIMGMLVLGYGLFAMLNLVLQLTGVMDGWGVYSQPMGWLVGLFGAALASYSLAIDFDSVDRGVAAQVPEKYSWLMAHGIMVTVVWLYIEIVRLIALTRD